MDPWDDDIQPKKKTGLALTFAHRTVWEEGQADGSDSDAVEYKLDHPDEGKLVGKSAQKPPPPISSIPHTKTKGDVHASVQPTVDEMDMDDVPIIE